MDAQPCSISKTTYTSFKHNNSLTVQRMTKQQPLPFGTVYSSDIPKEIRETFIQEFEEWEVEKQRQMDIENARLLSEREKEQLNTAFESIADKLGIKAELATIDALLQARNTRISRILNAAYSNEGQSTLND